MPPVLAAVAQAFHGGHGGNGPCTEVGVRERPERFATTKATRIEHLRCVEEHFDRSMERLERDHDNVPREQMAALFQVLATHDLLTRFMSVMVESHGLSFASFRLLAIVAKEPEQRVPLHRLSEWLSVSRQNVTGVVDGLEKRALVRRCICGADRRVKWVEITDAGLAVLRAISPRHFTAVRALFGGLDSAQLTDLTRLLTNVRERVLTLGPELEPSFRLDEVVGAMRSCPAGADHPSPHPSGEPFRPSSR